MSHDHSACTSYTITYKVGISFSDNNSKKVICMNRTMWATLLCCYSAFEFFDCALRFGSLNLFGQIKEVKPRLFLCQQRIYKYQLALIFTKQHLPQLFCLKVLSVIYIKLSSNSRMIIFGQIMDAGTPLHPLYCGCMYQQYARYSWEKTTPLILVIKMLLELRLPRTKLNLL